MSRFRLRNFFMLTIAGIVNACGVTLFLAPVNLYDSGISGTSMLLDYLTPEYLSLSLFLVILNIPLFLYGLKRQGKIFTVYAIYTVAIYSLFSYLITYVLPIDVSSTSPLGGTDLLLCSVFGGLISGAGSGLAIRFGGAMDGIEVMAVIFSKRLGITVGTFVMIYNIVLYVACGVLLNSWTLPLYSIVAYAVALKTVDFIVEGFDRAKCAMIITTKPYEVCKVLSDNLDIGSTKISVKGGFTDEEKTMVYAILNRFQVAKAKDLIHELDPASYITISEVADVFRSNQTK